MASQPASGRSSCLPSLIFPHRECRYESCAGTQLGLPLAGAAIGGAIGWAVDRAIGGWTTVFDRTSDPPRVSLLVGRGEVALVGAFTW